MISERSENIPPFLVMEVLEKAQQMEKKGIDIIHLEIGEPDFDTPEKIKIAAINAIHNDATHYTHSLGIWELREAVAQYYKSHYNVDFSPEQVIVTLGTSPALLLTLCTLLNAGDQVVLSDPGYACYPNFIQYINAVPVTVPLNANNGFIFQPDDIKNKLSSKTRAVLINSPSNPTGTILPPEILSKIAGLGPYIISDEIYHGLVYEGKAHSILEFTDKAFVLNGFSKLFAMTGWRLGYIIAPREFVRPIQKAQQNFYICANSISQWAGVSALTEDHPELSVMLETYDKRRKVIVEGLKKLGFGIYVEPTGAFYVLADARFLSQDSYKLAFDILEKAHVAVTPGIDFGQSSEGFLRFSYANSVENIQEGLARLQKYIQKMH